MTINLTAIIITALICAALVAICYVGHKAGKDDKK